MNKKLYLCFVDFSKAFGRVWRDGLLVKLLRHGVGGKFYGSVKQMYLNTISAVKINNSITTTFKSEVGVKQGDNLSLLCLMYTSTILSFQKTLATQLNYLPFPYLIFYGQMIYSLCPSHLSDCKSA